MIQAKKREGKGAGMPGTPRSNLRARAKASLPLYCMLALPLLYYLIFQYVPLAWLTLAFKDYNAVAGLWASDWVGFKHFLAFFAAPDFWQLIRNTVLLSLFNILWGFPMPIILALMVNEVRHSKLKKVVQNITYLPHFFSTVLICGLVVNLLSTEGIVNKLVFAMTGAKTPFLTTPEWFRTIYVGSGIWQSIGWGSIIYLAALSGVDQQLYESAVLDGASKLQQIWYISLASITPLIVIQLLLSLSKIMSVGFEKVLLLYNGSIYETADIISTYVYRRGLQQSQFSYGTAVDLFNSAINVLLVFIANKISKKVGDVGLW
ncbi:MAG: ABC transporter permease [Oscillospiraceae bacterium]